MTHINSNKPHHNPNNTGFYCGWCRKPFKGSKMTHDAKNHADKRKAKK